MFSFERDASKVALANLVARLNHCGFSLLDTQFITDHLRSALAVLKLIRPIIASGCKNGESKARPIFWQSTAQPTPSEGFTAGQPDIEYGMFDPVNTWTFGKHPA